MNRFTPISRSLAATAVAAALIIGPAIAFAEDNQSQPVITTAPKVSVSINNNGKVSLAGAKVTSVGSSTLTVTTGWGSSVITWSVNTANAKVLYKGGANATGAVVVVGDTVNIDGSLNTSVSGLTVNATTVRDLSREKSPILQKHTFEGTLNAAIGTTSLPTTFALKIANTLYTVNVPQGISVLNKNWATTNLSSFVAGDTVRVYGSAESSNTSILDAVVVRDATR